MKDAFAANRPLQGWEIDTAKIGVDAAGGHSVHADMRRELESQLTHETDGSVLAGGVERSTALRIEPGVRDREDHRAAARHQGR